MEKILNTLGFTDPVSIFWNVLAYLGMLMIITAVVSPRVRNQLFVWGPFLLLLYAGIYLRDLLLVALQVIITTSGVLTLLKVKKASYIVITLAIIAYIVLFLTNQFSGIWHWVGSFGLFGIAIGLIQLPKKRGFVLMTIGGVLICIYAWFLQIWVFFILNVIFFFANIRELRKN